jgi:hypothetical protein
MPFRRMSPLGCSYVMGHDFMDSYACNQQVTLLYVTFNHTRYPLEFRAFALSIHSLTHSRKRGFPHCTSVAFDRGIGENLTRGRTRFTWVAAATDFVDVLQLQYHWLIHSSSVIQKEHR